MLEPINVKACRMCGGEFDGLEGGFVEADDTIMFGKPSFFIMKGGVKVPASAVLYYQYSRPADDGYFLYEYSHFKIEGEWEGEK